MLTSQGEKGKHPLRPAWAAPIAGHLAVHGHHHDALDSSARWMQQGFKSFGVGLRGITAIDINGQMRVVVPGEGDRERRHRPG